MKHATKIRLRLFGIFYTGMLLTNVSISAVFAMFGLIILGPPFFLKMFAISFMTAGPVLTLLYKEITGRDQYYFYYNKGISKLMLIVSNVIINLVFGIIIFNIPLHG